MEKQNNPKLELKLNESVKLRLLKDKCYEGTNTYGPFYLYSVANGNGVEMSFFAPAEVHQQIVAHGLRAGSEFILHKKAAQNGKKITSELIFEPIELEQAREAADNLMEIMQRCLEEAVQITKLVQGVPWQNEDIRSISACLFIARTKSNGHV